MKCATLQLSNSSVFLIVHLLIVSSITIYYCDPRLFCVFSHFAALMTFVKLPGEGINGCWLTPNGLSFPWHQSWDDVSAVSTLGVFLPLHPVSQPLPPAAQV